MNPYSGWGHSPQHHTMSHSMPAAFPSNPHLMTGPARALDCIPSPVPMPNGVLAKGIRNPYVPYAGETYRPAPTSAYGGLGGYRMDDGWEGSVGRSHVGHAPDPMSTVGAVLRQPIPGGMHPMGMSPGMGMGMGGGGLSMAGGGWQNSPSSFHSHARMTPSLALDVPPPQGPPIHRSGSQRRPQGSPSSHARGIPIYQGCERCEARSQSGVGGGGGRRMSDGMLPPLGGSPLRHHREERLRRHASGSSPRSGGRGSFSSDR